MEKKRGFVTVATGHDKYYEMAANLLLSYKGRGRGTYPFALICDKENEYSALFDDVVIVEDIRCSTVDKLLIRHSPYAETLFLDADTLVLDNIDDLWDVFQDQDDVSAFGCTLPLDSLDGWFTYEGSGRYKSRVNYLMAMNGGIYYFRKSEKAERVFREALEVAEEYDSIDFKYFDTPQDEPLMAMSMVINGCQPCTAEYEMLILPVCDKPIRVDRAGRVYEGLRRSGAKMIHFSTPRTELFLYHYLNEINHRGGSGTGSTGYLRTWLRYAFKELRFGLCHAGGAVLRKAGLNGTVEMLKKALH